MHIEVFLQDTAPICIPTSFRNGTRFEPEEYLCGDSRLGPKELPTSPPFATLLSGYERLGGMCTSEFQKKWGDGDFYTFIDPPADGFQLSTRHKPIADDQVLERGMLVDTFGGGIQLQLPLACGDAFRPARTSDDVAVSSYRIYGVEYPFVVMTGPRVAFFGWIFDRGGVEERFVGDMGFWECEARREVRGCWRSVGGV
ncbi:hypothetical protein B0H14DRAFT_3129527 [Mycena olivaceomarginata]|nr:hypothetical protein B0H14DRAFT_3129527 [Mycena olivaceomarginata]